MSQGTTDTNADAGWHVYTQNLWSFLDVTFSCIFGIYLVLRIHGWRTGEIEPGQQALDVLAMGAPVLVPRLAFNLMSENMLFVSLRAMMRDFTVRTIKFLGSLSPFSETVSLPLMHPQHFQRELIFLISLQR